MNMNEQIDHSVIVTFEGKQLQPEVTHELLWRIDDLKIMKIGEVYTNIILPIFSQFTEENKKLILHDRLNSWNTRNETPQPRFNYYYSSNIINSLIIETIKNKIHTIPLSSLVSMAVSHYDETYGYSYSSFLSWTGHWTKTKLWLNRQWSFNSIISDWQLLTNEFPAINTKIQYTICNTYHGESANNDKLTINIKNGKLEWNLDEPSLRPDDRSYSCMRRPKIKILTESFKNVCNKFAGTSRFSLPTAKKSKTLAAIKKHN